MLSNNRGHELRTQEVMRLAEKADIAVDDNWRTLVNFWVLAALVMGTAAISGCESGNGLAPVHGIVTLDGEPLSEGFVYVTPEEGKMAKGTIQSNGKFALGTHGASDGAQVGKHPVTVKPPPAAEGQPLSTTAKKLPDRYSKAQTSGITVEVKPNTDNELTIELTSD